MTKLNEDQQLEKSAAVQDFVAAARVVYGSAYTERYWMREALLVIKDDMAEGHSFEHSLAVLYDQTEKFHRLADRPSRTIPAYSWS